MARQINRLNARKVATLSNRGGTPMAVDFIYISIVVARSAGVSCHGAADDRSNSVLVVSSMCRSRWRANALSPSGRPLPMAAIRCKSGD